MSLIPVGVDFIHSLKPYNSCDAPIFIAGSDGLDYLAKLPNAENPCMSAAEAIAYGMCGRLGLAVPACAWLEFADGRVAFGSRIEPGVSQFSQLDAETRQDALLACRAQIARFCLLDAFLSNPDRHADNLLFRKSPLNNRWTVMNMDFSRALWRGGFPATPVDRVLREGNTGSTVALLRALGAFEATMVASVVAGLQAIEPEQVAAAIAEIPEAARCAEALHLPEWWSCDERMARADQLMDSLP